MIQFFLLLGLCLLMGGLPAVSHAENKVKPLLKSCPSWFNCVASNAKLDDVDHYIEPLVFAGSHKQAWKAVKQAVLVLPRCKIVIEQSFYLKVECRSFLFRFVDDLELQMNLDKKQIAVRSASRVGRFDFGVNRKRVELLREKLR